MVLLPLLACGGGTGAARSGAAQSAPSSAGDPSGGPALSYDARFACIDGKRFTNTVIPDNEGEFASHGFDRMWWGRPRGNAIGGNRYSGFQTSWGRRQYDTYFGDQRDGLPGGRDPFRYLRDEDAPGTPMGVRIAAIPMPPELASDPRVGGAKWYSGVLDTPIHQQYGFFVARLRMPEPKRGMSPAWWLLTNDGVPDGPHGKLAGEWDVQEMFGEELAGGMNAGTILWNSGETKNQNWGGTYDWPAEAGSSATHDYHDYGALIMPGGAPLSKEYFGKGGPGYVDGKPGTGVTNYLDGRVLRGHSGGADVTWGVAWKELMVMFQLGGWLGAPNPADFPAYFWVQWIRVYEPTSAAC